MHTRVSRRFLLIGPLLTRKLLFMTLGVANYTRGGWPGVANYTLVCKVRICFISFFINAFANSPIVTNIDIRRNKFIVAYFSLLQMVYMVSANCLYIFYVNNSLTSCYNIESTCSSHWKEINGSSALGKPVFVFPLFSALLLHILRFSSSRSFLLSYFKRCKHRKGRISCLVRKVRVK